MARKDLGWCLFRNLAHTVYREARHIGPPGDGEARLVIGDGDLAGPALKCMEWREVLKSTFFYDRGESASTPFEVLKTYLEITGLSPEDLVRVFGLPGWQRRYGGLRWAAIAEVMVQLRDALVAKDGALVARLCAEIPTLEHNNGRLIPSMAEWRERAYLREKWPRLWGQAGSDAS